MVDDRRGKFLCATAVVAVAASGLSTFPRFGSLLLLLPSRGVDRSLFSFETFAAFFHDRKPMSILFYMVRYWRAAPETWIFLSSELESCLRELLEKCCSPRVLREGIGSLYF